MVWLLGEVLDVPLRSRNELLRAGGFEPTFPEPTVDELLAGELGAAIDLMLEHGDPFPVMVMDRWHRLVRTNSGGRLLLEMAGIDLAADPNPNLLTVLFEPQLRQFLVNWEEVAGQILRRVQRIVLRDPADEHMGELLAELEATPGIPEEWRLPDLSDASAPTVSMHVEVGDVRLRLLTTITVFHAPNNVTLEELQIESYLPLDDGTRAFFGSV